MKVTFFSQFISPRRNTRSWHKLLPVFFLYVAASCSSGREISQKPILFDEERSSLSIQYLADHYGLEQYTPSIKPRMIVLHHTVITSLQETFEALYPATLPEKRHEIQAAGLLNVSAHYVVDRDGTIYQLLPDTLMARHVIGLNHCAIGIENVGGTPELPLNRAQVRADIRLVQLLKEKYNIDYLIGHHEYLQFEGHELWLEKDSTYRTVKTDPGKDFMKRVRAGVKKLNFKPVPKNIHNHE